MNDFVLVKDRTGLLNPGERDVRFLCDRHAGIGADGFLRAVEAEAMPEWHGPAGLWFMDYRNADGSSAEICGNGLRVFARWLVEEGLATGNEIDVATRAGLRRVAVHPDGAISVRMGTPRRESATAMVQVGGRQWRGHLVDVGNPHCVVEVAAEELKGLDLTTVQLDPLRFPTGGNVEFCATLSENRLALRVVERGVGETRSCGSGVVAASFDAYTRSAGTQASYQVRVPGGTLAVDFTPDGEAILTGPAVIVARGKVTLPDD